MQKINTVWNIRPCDNSVCGELAYELEIPTPVARVMATRGIDSIKKAKSFTSLKIGKLHDPFLLPDAKKAIDRRTGARGLRAIVENLLLEVMYEAPSKKSIKLIFQRSRIPPNFLDISQVNIILLYLATTIIFS